MRNYMAEKGRKKGWLTFGIWLFLISLITEATAHIRQKVAKDVLQAN